MLARAFSSILLISGVTLAQFRCPEPKGFFPDPEQCDLYFACVDGKAEEKLCKDGLVFRDDNPKKELCDIPANVPCGDRTLLRKLHYFILSNFFLILLITVEIIRRYAKEVRYNERFALFGGEEATGK